MPEFQCHTMQQPSIVHYISSLPCPAPFAESLFCQIKFSVRARHGPPCWLNLLLRELSFDQIIWVALKLGFKSKLEFG